MLRSRSDLDREQIRDELVALLGAEQICTDEAELALASVDRFKKYQSVNGVFLGPVPAAIARVRSSAEVAAVLRFANEHLINVVPSTGRSATEGGLETIVEDSIVLDGSPMRDILAIDEVDMMATAQCGVCLQDLEDAVRERGLTTGNSPQSRPLAQLGGLTATRSIGQLSTLYGAIEDQIVGLEAVFPDGTICRVKSVPRRAAGPDVRQIVIGSEGALCFVTEVTVKLFRYRPENEHYRGFLVDDMETGLELIRQLLTDGYRPSVCRLYSEDDARQHWGETVKGKCVMIFVSEGPAPVAAATASAIDDLVAAGGHQMLPEQLVVDWFANLNWGPDKIRREQEQMLSEHWLGYTTEISASWSQVGAIYRSAMSRIRTEFPYIGDVTMLGAHSSHSYQTGTNLYFVYDYKVDCAPEEEITKYHIPINAIIVEEALRHGGSMVHHHGIGKYRSAWTEEEHGSAYYLLEKLKEAFDPNGVMNKGTIFNA